jgi:chaperone required for assembly of F1-ATPase
MVDPLIANFNKTFNMNIKPSATLQPPKCEFSKEFIEFIDSLDNWRLIGLETMTIWMKSTISALSIIGKYL